MGGHPKTPGKHPRARGAWRADLTPSFPLSARGEGEGEGQGEVYAGVAWRRALPDARALGQGVLIAGIRPRACGSFRAGMRLSALNRPGWSAAEGSCRLAR